VAKVEMIFLYQWRVGVGWSRGVVCGGGVDSML
jgi:hypothetical protein